MNAIFRYQLGDAHIIELELVIDPRQSRDDLFQEAVKRVRSCHHRIYEVELFIDGSSVMKAVHERDGSRLWSLHMTSDDLFSEFAVATLVNGSPAWVAMNMIAVNDTLSYAHEEFVANSYVINPFVDTTIN